MKKIYFIVGFIAIANIMVAQNVGIGTTAPASKLHIKGTVDVSQFIIDAHSTQSNINPLIKLRKSDGSDLMWIHSDDSSNVFMGINAGRINNGSGGLGITNTFIGSSSGYSNSDGSENTATGWHSLYFNTTGGDNTANGVNALYSNTTGSNNTANGVDALYFNSTGSSNIAIGVGALLLNTTGSNNTAIGMTSLYSNTTASDNTATGYAALYSNTTGSQNTANGQRALYLNTTGGGNTANGKSALSSNTIGSQNIAMGYASLVSNTTASENVAIGSNALQDQSFSNGGVSWVSANVAVGDGALLLNQPTSTSNGINNTAIGHSALRTNSTGAYNSATGMNALYSNTTGTENTATGYQALYSNTTGFLNAALGVEALHSNSTGSSNTAIGHFALYSNFGGTGNTAVGKSALSNVVSGTNNTALGYLSGPTNGTLSNSTCIGSGSQATASNQMVLGDANVTQFYCQGAFAGTTAAAPNLTVLNTGQIVRSTSSRRYKKDITALEINTANIYQLRPVSYDSYTDNSRHFGLIAEEVAEIIPELASYSKEKDVIKGSSSDELIPDAVQYPLLSVLLLNEVQKHEQTIKELKATITEMKNLMATQQKQIDALKK